ncbi:cell division protein ZapA [Segetibacter sp. 3557_3]|uniref:cell division protein ZapA n=1 Tax=Segetibacter sp. 3557_3 TaxID=2547429 RepID=UPI0010586A3F|nr:cell division protein ZapA [Segetibacter sp. 3557_3]TDH19812.1 cell division protein ZapA [Segetibacter sp. 3557_3]
MSQELIPVNIVLADRNYRLKIAPSDEEVVRRTIKTINEKIIEYKTEFAGKDMQDYVSMVLLWYATEQQKPTNNQVISDQTRQKIDKLNQLLDKALAGSESSSL